jgi:hypothetical protein
VMAEGKISGGTKFLPYSFGHDTGICPFIDDTLMDGDVPYFDGYLNSDGGGKTRFAAIKVESDKSSICRVDCSHGGN